MSGTIEYRIDATPGAEEHLIALVAAPEVSRAHGYTVIQGVDSLTGEHGEFQEEWVRTMTRPLSEASATILEKLPAFAAYLNSRGYTTT